MAYHLDDYVLISIIFSQLVVLNIVVKGNTYNKTSDSKSTSADIFCQMIVFFKY